MFLVDADAFICLRKFGLLRPIAEGSVAGGRGPLFVTQYVARHELSPLATELADLEAAGLLRVEPLERRGRPGQLFKNLREGGLDKGESESLAWLLLLAARERPVYLSLDTAATATARKRKVCHVDVLGAAALAVSRRLLDRAVVRACLVAWEDQRQSFCRPTDFTTFDETFAARLAGLDPE